MLQYSAIQWLFFFYFYCFFGWCFESTYVSICKRKLVNRGFMKGPFLPLYGSGAIMMLVVSAPFRDNIVLTFLAGVVGATILEYVTGLVMETIFKVRYWDYSGQFLNFQGRICLTSSLAWGGLTILMTRVVHQYVERVMLWIPSELLTVFVIVLTAYITADFALAFKEAIDLRDMLMKAEQLKEEVAHLQKRLDVVIAVTVEDLRNKKEEFREELELYIEDTKLDAAAKKEVIEKKLRTALAEKQNRAVEITTNTRKRLSKVLKANPGMKSVYFRFWDEWKKH